MKGTQVSDIVEMLRTPTGCVPPSKWELAAAKEIEKLRKKVDRYKLAYEESYRLGAEWRGKAETYAEWQQQRGRHADIIQQAIDTYDEWMKDDDFDATTALRKIIERMRERL